MFPSECVRRKHGIFDFIPDRCYNNSAAAECKTAGLRCCWHLLQRMDGAIDMLFNSLQFVIFFPIVVLIYFFIPKRMRYIWLLAASYFFYMCWNPKYVLLLLFSTGISYAAGLLLERWRDRPKQKKAVVAVGAVLNFSILFLFKYLDFVWQSAGAVLEKFHFSLPENTLVLLLPVGISFYIFQVVGYIVDVYRGTIEAERNFARYALFISFFPQLVAGPIERSKNLLPQIRELEKLKLWDSERIQKGALVMVYGYILKMVLADRAALYVDTVFSVENFGVYQGIPVFVAAALFAVQIYCDFAGYTYIAIGAAQIMGIRLMNNFNAPYFAVSFKDFWDRWHISLSTWFRDYLYFPLGGSRKGRVRKYLNILLVFCVSGLWHGAAWHYVIWGCLHGICRVIGELTAGFRNNVWQRLKVNTEVFSFRLWRRLFMFTAVSIIWIFFRVEAVSQAFLLIKNMLAVWNPWVLFDGSLFSIGLDSKDWNILIVALVLLLSVDRYRVRQKSLPEAFVQQNLVFRWLVIFAGIFAVLIFGVYGADYNAVQFIYFQF